MILANADLNFQEFIGTSMFSAAKSWESIGIILNIISFDYN